MVAELSGKVKLSRRSEAVNRSIIYRLPDGTALVDAARQRGVALVTVYARLRRGYSVEDALSGGRPAGRPVVHRMDDGSPVVDHLRDCAATRRAVYRALAGDAVRYASTDEIVAAECQRVRSRGPGCPRL